MLPSLFLVVYLLFETAKISREKIRHQFAVDAASFIEMTNYSDFLNRSAYVNGAFPQRIFYEGFYGTKIEKKDSTKPADRLFDILWTNGAFPAWQEKLQEAVTPPDYIDKEHDWAIRFNDDNVCGAAKNGKTHDPIPQMDACPCGDSAHPHPTCLTLLTLDDAKRYWISWEDAMDIYKLYVQIYQLLGSVEDAQYRVFSRLTDGHNFFRKSYWLNTGEDCAGGTCGASGFPTKANFDPKPYCVASVTFYGNKPTSNAFQPYLWYAPSADGVPDMSGMNVAPGCKPGAGLFQAESMSESDLKALKTPHGGQSTYPGYPITQIWRAPANYFLVDFNGGRVRCPATGTTSPCVHSTVMLGNPCSQYNGCGLWPNPTPKFQVRLYP